MYGDSVKMLPIVFFSAESMLITSESAGSVDPSVIVSPGIICAVSGQISHDHAPFCIPLSNI